MAQQVIFPKLGQTMEEGAIVKWLKQEGDKVAKGDILFEIETDKANLEVESFWEGTLIKIVVKEGITVPVNTVVGFIGEAGEKAPDAPAAAPASAPAPEEKKSAAPAPAVPAAAIAAANAASKKSAAPVASAPVAAPAPAAVAPVAPAAPQKLFISPRAKALVKEAAISANNIKGTGDNGRITEKDVRGYMEAHNYSALLITPAAKCLAQNEGIDVLSVRGSGEDGRITVEDIRNMIARKPVALSRMRQTIARRLVESKQTIPHFYVTVAVDMTDLQVFRAELKAKGTSYSVNDFILEAAVLSLVEMPVVNSKTDGKTIAWRGDVELGVAVSVESGLLVPVVNHAQTLTLAELSVRAKELAKKARDGKLAPDEMTGSSFTVSNMGMMDVENFMAIVNPGEAAILAVSSAKPTPVVRDGKIAIRSIMKMTLSADHRIVDGSTAAAFANAIRMKLENLELWKSLV